MAEIPKFKSKKAESQKKRHLTIRIGQKEIAQAKVLAKEKGIGYQTLMRMWIIEGIKREWKPQMLTDDISTQDLMRLVERSGSFDWLEAEEEDIYSLNDGETVQWPDENEL